MRDTNSEMIRYQEALSKAEKRIQELKSALKQCADDPLFKIHFTVKYIEFKKLLKE